jgi:hypothetical protein
MFVSIDTVRLAQSLMALAAAVSAVRAQRD